MKYSNKYLLISFHPCKFSFNSDEQSSFKHHNITAAPLVIVIEWINVTEEQNADNEAMYFITQAYKNVHISTELLTF